MAKRINGVWVLREFGKYPNAEIQQAEDVKKVKVTIFPDATGGFSFETDRRTARLLARRINQFLDST